jgi:phosphoglycolate phosphatase-like HAD superfamily hydrolase
MIGDSLSDMQSAQSAGIGTRIYLNPSLPLYKGRLVPPTVHPYYQAKDLASAGKLI